MNVKESPHLVQVEAAAAGRHPGGSSWKPAGKDTLGYL
jgi:hypothetical protein